MWPKRRVGESYRSHFSRKATGPLFHYTSLTGLEGILETGEIWATNIRYLNDSSEYRHGIQLARDIAQELSDKSHGEDKAFYEAILDILRFKYGDYVLDMYVASFCENKDELSLWRGYCLSGGYSFGYDWRNNVNEELLIAPCMYRNEDKKDLIIEDLEICRTHDIGTIREELRRHGHDVRADTTEAQIRAINFALSLIFYTAALKHEGFRDEREWRVMCIPHSQEDVRYRKRGNMMIPYIPINLCDENRLNVPRIIVGPLDSRRQAAENAIP